MGAILEHFHHLLAQISPSGLVARATGLHSTNAESGSGRQPAVDKCGRRIGKQGSRRLMRKTHREARQPSPHLAEGERPMQPTQTDAEV